MKLEDRDLTCSNCARRFIFTTGEQELLLSRGLSLEPDRCPPCSWLAGRRIRRGRDLRLEADS